MNALLIGPSLFKAGEMTYITPPLGVLSIAAVLRDLGWAVTFFDANLKSDEDLEAVLNSKHFDLIGIGSLWDSIFLDADVSKKAREKQPNAIIVMGGYSATYTSEKLLELSSADILVLGEGEKPIREIARRVEQVALTHPLNWLNVAQYLKDIKGLIIRTETKLIETGGNPPLTWEELNEVPLPAFDLVDYREYWATLAKHENMDPTELYTIRIQASRGCNEACLFCCSTRFFDKARDPKAKTLRKQAPYIRFIRAGRVVDMIEAAIRPYPEVRTIFFNDDNFNAAAEYAIEVSQEIIKAKEAGRLPADLTFTCFGRVDNAKPEMLEWMKKAGFRLICFGIESGSDHVLKTIGKRFTMEQVAAGLEATKKSGIVAYSWIIVLTPKSTVDDVLLTLYFVIDCLSKGIGIGLYLSMVPFPCTPMTVEAERKGLIRYAGENIRAEEGGGTNTTMRGTAILPEDPVLQRVYHGANEAFDRCKADFMSRHRITHLPRKTLTYIWLLALITSLSQNTGKDLSALRQAVLDVEPKF